MRVMSRLLLATILVAASSGAGAWAHDASLHHGKPTTGVVENVSGDHLTLATSDGEIPVILNESTHIERDGKDADREALEPGARARVFGTKLPSGELVAKELQVESSGPRAAVHH
jgi:hypothetical protein